ncbi:pancreatic trypsin inhibitor-like isoform X2 [Heterocephalus glaber]|uniref:Pancreatic trypsin inhibitor-like isoform X2 n=1 Tax=Heterocephalus glaber TaxID=10181 RepID=A0AAX6RCZ2_HETGA|nr:pancreatic trypsin inhibitor-like isoform X2 [Heterocephalus glaber]
MHRLSLSAVLLVLLVTLVASTQERGTSAPSQAPPPAFCLDPPYTGPCKALFPRFFFNATSRLCEKFVYGGCRAKQNNFQNKEQCVQTCAPPPAFCLDPPYTGPCKALFPRFFFNATSRLCEKFVYGGCRAKQNNFQNKEQCVQTCVMLKPVLPGPGKVQDPTPTIPHL